jgi:hypothetical protein
MRLRSHPTCPSPSRSPASPPCLLSPSCRSAATALREYNEHRRRSLTQLGAAADDKLTHPAHSVSRNALFGRALSTPSSPASPAAVHDTRITWASPDGA